MQRQFRREEDLIHQTKSYLKSQKTDLATRQSHLDEARTRWKAEMEEIARRFQMSTSIEPTPSVNVQDDITTAKRMSVRQDTGTDLNDLQQDLDQLLRGFKKQQLNTPNQFVSVPPVSSIPSRLSATTNTPLIIRTEIKSSPAHSLLNDLGKKRNVDLLKQHDAWLQDFRHKIGSHYAKSK
jgi:hypothetical protein